MFPIAGPSRARITITIKATNTRIKAYSTNPCPSSRGRNSICLTPSHLGLSAHCGLPSVSIVLFLIDFATLGKKGPASRDPFWQCCLLATATCYMALTMLLKMLPIAGPSRARMTITTIATRTRIKAYSTSPCPSSRGRNSICLTTFHLDLTTITVLVLIDFGNRK
jgi:hypothetical protein